MARMPSYRLHRPSGQAVVTLSGKDFYLGKHGTEDSKKRYLKLTAEWLASRKSPCFGEVSPNVAQVALAFLKHAEGYYGIGTELKNFRLATRPLAELYGDLPASEFGPVEFKACREWWLSDSSRTRQYINKQMKRLVHIFKWAAGEGLAPVTVFQTIGCVPPLQQGRTPAKEAEPVLSVPDLYVGWILPYLPKVVRDMVLFQRLTALRPGEICQLTPAMVDRRGDVWSIFFTKHKTAYRGKNRTAWIGKAAQQILAPYLLRESTKPCFSPREALQQIGVTPRASVRDAFDPMSYAQSVRRACIKAFPALPGIDATWSPNQLRHSRATEIRRNLKNGLEAASVSLGHSGLKITEVYAEQNEDLAIEVAKALG